MNQRHAALGFMQSAYPSRVWPGVFVGLLPCLGVVVACSSSYDERLLALPALSEFGLARCGDGELGPYETCDRGIAEGRSGACPTACPDGPSACEPQVLAGDECKVQCAIVPILDPRNGDGCCPEGADATTDSDCGSCGDGIVGPAETCDPPEDCPTREWCTSELSCVTTVYSGSAKKCTAYCEFQESAACGEDDDCCPSDCEAKRDDDCSQVCGDGIVDTDAGELCEPESKTQACAGSCDDDDSCTRDMMVGSASNCNVACLHNRIVLWTSGDGCCPPFAVSIIDSDCARCGNAIVERGEQCDGTTDCSDDCSLRAATTLLHRYSFDGEGMAVRDSVGTAHGTAVNTTLRGMGDLQLTQAGDTYVDLPDGILSMGDGATLEIWITWRGDLTRRYERIFDFGNTTPSGSARGAVGSTVFLSPNYDGSGTPRLSYRNAALQVTSLMPSRGFPANERMQIAAVFDNRQQTMSLYLNGSVMGSTAWAQSLTDIKDENNWLGRSQYQDPNLWATFDEFRIYGDALSAAAIAASYAAGPDALP